MTSPEWRDEINKLIENLRDSCANKTDIDDIYGNMCSTIFSEMDKYLNYREYSGRKAGKRFKYHKPYWNDQLTNLWKNMCVQEKAFLKLKGQSRVRSFLRVKFVNARAAFDKYLRYCQRKYRKQTIIDLEKICTDDPRRFWEHVKNLGPKKRSSIPTAVKTDTGVSEDPQVVSDTWKHTFENLYNSPNMTFDENFLAFVQQFNANLERNIDTEPQNNYQQVLLNSDITFNETAKVIRKLKVKKATGLDSCLQYGLKL